MLFRSDEFIEAVLQDKEWALVFPFKEGGEEAQALDLKDPKQVIWRSWASDDGYVVNKKGLTACRCIDGLVLEICGSVLWNPLTTLPNRVLY